MLINTIAVDGETDLVESYKDPPLQHLLLPTDEELVSVLSSQHNYHLGGARASFYK